MLALGVRLAAAVGVIVWMNWLLAGFMPTGPVVSWLQWGVIPAVAAALWYFTLRAEVSPEGVIVAAGVVYLIGYLQIPGLMVGISPT